MTARVLISCYAMSLAMVIAQPNPARPDLCQGAYFTEAEGAAALQKFAQTHHDRASWEARAKLIRQGLRDGMQLPEKPKFAPLQPIRHSVKKMNGYTIENVAFESIPGFFVTGNLYKPLNASGKLPAILCPHGHAAKEDARFQEQTQKRCATMARLGAVVFVYDMIGYGDSKQTSHKLPEALKLQTLNGMRSLDFLMSLPEVDKTELPCRGSRVGEPRRFCSRRSISGLRYRCP